jgi:energy-coupling factor transporter ATP-binding protein EcfA2
MKIKLFYSYSHKDEVDRDELEKHLATLRNDGLIDEWHDRKISAGDEWEGKINNEMSNAHIILLLFSADFIASSSCQKEIRKALELKNKTGTVFIPVILKVCSWMDIKNISKIQALPKDGKSVSSWNDKNEAWMSVYEGIKNQVEKLRSEIVPILKKEFKKNLLKNPIMDSTLDKLFVYPDILETNKSKQKLENNEINSKKLIDIKTFKHNYILIEGAEQSGKTSLCRMLYLQYENTGFFPVLINGKHITGKANIKNIVNEEYQKQYDSTKEYWSLEKEKRFLLIDDINNKSANDKNYAIFLQSIRENFEYAIVLIDELSNLSNKSTEHDHFYLFNDYSISPLGFVRRDELIKKCIESDEDIEFDMANTEQVVRLDNDTKHINTIIGSNILPSYPVFIVSTFNIIESSAHHDMQETSYGHCYHAMITMQLHRANIQANDMDKYFNFLTEFSYFIFSKNKKSVSQDELDEFIKIYDEEYIFDESIIKNLIESNSLINKNDIYSFQYIYIYYYFVAKYIADHINKDGVKKQIQNLLSDVHKKDNSNIIVFITHHTKNADLLDSILSNATAHFEKFSESTLDRKETEFISESIRKLNAPTVPPNNHNPEKTRIKTLKQKDVLKLVVDKLENEAEDEDDLLLIEIRKSAKSMEIIGQIMRNQYGTFKKDRLRKMFEEGQNTGLRLIKSFIDLMSNDGVDAFVQQRLIQIENEKGSELSKEGVKRKSERLIAGFSHDVIFGWIHKIVDSLGYDKLISIADEVNNKTDTVASKLINFSIHAWHKKEIDDKKIKFLLKEFKHEENSKDKNRGISKKNYLAEHMLKLIVSRHIYMHKFDDFKKKQRIEKLLGFSVKSQLDIQSKIGKSNQ